MKNDRFGIHGQELFLLEGKILSPHLADFVSNAVLCMGYTISQEDFSSDGDYAWTRLFRARDGYTIEVVYEEI